MEIRSPDKKKKKRIYVLKSIPSCVLAGKALHAWLGFYTECEILLPPLLTPSWLQLRWAERRSSSNTNKNITKQLLSDIIEWLHLILLMYVHLCLFLVLCTLLHQYCWRWRMPQEMVGFGAEILKEPGGGEESFPDRRMVEGWEAELIPSGTAQWHLAALPAPCWQAELRCGHLSMGSGVTSAGLAQTWLKD